MEQTNRNVKQLTGNKIVLGSTSTLAGYIYIYQCKLSQ